MSEPDWVAIAKEAYVLAQQLEALHAAMTAPNANAGSYRACARTYSTHLARARQLLSVDDTIARTVAHLPSYNPEKPTGYAADSEQIKADLSVLRAALASFFEFHFPAAEKEKIGFGRR